MTNEEHYLIATTCGNCGSEQMVKKVKDSEVIVKRITS